MPYPNPGGEFAGLFNALEALPVQTFAEINAKKGQQQYVQLGFSLTAGATMKLSFRTPDAVPVLVKQRDFVVFGETVSIGVYRNPTGTSGGTVIPVFNFNDVNPAASTSFVKQGVTTTSNGNIWGAVQTLHGTNSAAQRATQIVSVTSERVLKPATDYLVVFTNTGSQDAQCEYTIIFREGNLDYPRLT